MTKKKLATKKKNYQKSGPVWQSTKRWPRECDDQLRIVMKKSDMKMQKRTMKYNSGN